MVSRKGLTGSQKRSEREDKRERDDNIFKTTLDSKREVLFIILL